MVMLLVLAPTSWHYQCQCQLYSARSALLNIATVKVRASYPIMPGEGWGHFYIVVTHQGDLWRRSRTSAQTLVVTNPFLQQGHNIRHEPQQLDSSRSHLGFRWNHLFLTSSHSSLCLSVQFCLSSLDITLLLHFLCHFSTIYLLLIMESIDITAVDSGVLHPAPVV